MTGYMMKTGTAVLCMIEDEEELRLQAACGDLVDYLRQIAREGQLEHLTVEVREGHRKILCVPKPRQRDVIEDVEFLMREIQAQYGLFLCVMEG